MAIDSAEKRQNLTGVGRPWMRSHFPVSAKDQEWRIGVGLAYGGNALSAALPSSWEMIPPWKQHRRIAMHRI